MSGRMNFDFTFSGSGGQSNPSPENDTPLRILILGNFSGAGHTPTAGRQPLRQRPFVRIDIDRFDEVFRRWAPRLQLGEEAGSFTEEIVFAELEDFRPERLCEKLPTFRQLLELRKKLLSPATFAQASAQLRQELMSQTAAPTRSEDVIPSTPVAATPATSAEDDAATLQRILGQQPARGSDTADRTADRSQPDIHRLIQQLVEPYIVPAADPNQGVYLAAADKALGDQMRHVLHSPAFQALEATWRSVHGLISSLEDDSEIQVHLLDVTQEELLADVPTDDEKLRQWSLYRRLTGDSAQTLGTAPWSLIIGDFTISARANELALLGALATTAEHLQAPLIAAAHSSLLGCPSLIDCPDPADWQPLDSEIHDYWQSLRRSPVADWVGLTLPRVLLRLPYGKETDVVDTFEFEEFSTTRRHEDYLWGNSAYLCAGLITQAFAEEGWSMQLPNQVDIGDQPAHTYSEDGEHKLQPCAEVAFGERVADAILRGGVMPLISWKDRNTVRFIRFQSVADPLTVLSGPWS